MARSDNSILHELKITRRLKGLVSRQMRHMGLDKETKYLIRSVFHDRERMLISGLATDEKLRARLIAQIMENAR